jgi:F-type H+-transporting ATPase subunit b
MMGVCSTLPALFAGGGSDASGLDLVLPNPGTMVWTWAIFLLLFLVLWKFAWGPIAKSLHEREQRIHGDVNRAEEARAKAEALAKQYEAKLSEIRGEAQAIIAEGKADAERLRVKMEADARSEAKRMVDEARREVALAKDAALAELREAAADMAMSMAAKAAGKILTPADEKRLRQEALAELAKN